MPSPEPKPLRVSSYPFAHVRFQVPGRDWSAALRRSGVSSRCAVLGTGFKTTVDHSLMRGLDTAGPRDSSWSCLCQRPGVGLATCHTKGPRILLTDPAPDTGHRSMVSGLRLLSSASGRSVQAACNRGSTSREIAQMNPTISRAIAVITMFFALPVAASRR